LKPIAESVTHLGFHQAIDIFKYEHTQRRKT